MIEITERLAKQLAEERAARLKAEGERDNWRENAMMQKARYQDADAAAVAAVRRAEVEPLQARLREVIEAADQATDACDDINDAHAQKSIAAYRRIRDAQPPASPEPHVFHNRLDEQQRKEGEQEPCMLCGRMLDDVIHGTHHEFVGAEPEASQQASKRECLDYTGVEAVGYYCNRCGQPWSQHGGHEDGK